jgi:hypothetical protein
LKNNKYPVLCRKVEAAGKCVTLFTTCAVSMHETQSGVNRQRHSVDCEDLQVPHREVRMVLQAREIVCADVIPTDGQMLKVGQPSQHLPETPFGTRPEPVERQIENNQRRAQVREPLKLRHFEAVAG